VPLFRPLVHGYPLTSGIKFCRKILETVDYHTVKTQSLYLTWTWMVYRIVTDGQTYRITIANTRYSYDMLIARKKRFELATEGSYWTTIANVKRVGILNRPSWRKKTPRTKATYLKPVDYNVWSVIGCLHDPANVQQTLSISTGILNTFAGSLLDVCWIV